MKGAAIRFWKMSGAGNDFIVLPLAPYALPVDPTRFVRRVCRRGVSVGADGVLFVVPPSAHEKASSLATSQLTATDKDRDWDRDRDRDRDGVRDRETATAAERSATMTTDGDAATATGRETATPQGRDAATAPDRDAATLPDGRAATPTDGATDRNRLPDVVLVHYNADGGRSDFCGNGTRCAARFAVAMGLASSPLTLRTDAGVLGAQVEEEWVRIDAPSPSEPVPRTLTVSGREHQGWFTVAGVPHFVLSVDDPGKLDVGALGAALRSHRELAPDGANIDFVGPEAAGRRRLRTFERGVEAETLACGSGALAAAAVLAREGAGSPIVLTPASGIDLSVEFEAGPDGARSFRLRGEARIVFEGVLAADPFLERDES